MPKFEALRRHLWIRIFVALTVLVILTTVLNHRIDDIPELGPLLSPYHGLWAHAPSVFEASGTAERLKVAGLKSRVELIIDADQVKHLFAENDDDLYFAQGYVTASDRLWQMDFLTRLAGGRLSEIIGRRGLEFDRFFLRLGLSTAAKESVQLMLQDAVTSSALKAYAGGVNAYIASLTLARLPFEYRLLGHFPEPWTPERTALLMKLMAYNLSGHSLELALERSRARLSSQDFDELFPLDLGIQDPIIPKGMKWSFNAKPPQAPISEFKPDLKRLEPYPAPNPSNGSNNWAVTGRKSSTGLPIVANDVHLDFQLPSLWYEIQLVSPTQNVYGAALPGAPGVVLGFNKSLAWAVTNGGSDVLDWYELRYRDEKKLEYLYDGEFRPVISTETPIKIRGEKAQALVTRRTHLGPIIYEDSETPLRTSIPKGLVMHWAGLEPSNELKTFLLLNRAASTTECREAILTFQTPAQNFLCADNRDDVGLWHNGRFPIRWKGQGRLILDGSTAATSWQGWIPREEIPFVRNPDRGFVSSANQLPADDYYPYYLGWPFESPYRGRRINELLREKSRLTPQDFISIQNDTLSIPARELKPALLDAVKGADLGQREIAALEALKSWDERFDEESVGAAIFDAWFEKLKARMWGERLGESKYYMHPPLPRTVKIIREEPNSKWFDNPDTPGVETLREQAVIALNDAVADLSRRLGRDVNDWKWHKARPTMFSHVAKLPGLGEKVTVRGTAQSVFANSGSHGPVWKLVVALGSKPKAWCAYPGGQSGDPSSLYYNNFMEPWRKGEMREVVYLLSAKDANPRFFRQWHLEKQ